MVEKKVPTTFRITLTALIACIFFFTFLLWNPGLPHDERYHVSELTLNPGSIGRGFHAVTVDYPYKQFIDTTKGYEVLDVTLAVQTVEPDAAMTDTQVEEISHLFLDFVVMNVFNETFVLHSEMIELSADEENEYDATWKKVKSRVTAALGGSTLKSLALIVSTNSSIPVSFMLDHRALGIAGAYRPLIAGVILASVYIVMLLDVVNRMLVAIVGSFIGLAALAALHGAESLRDAVTSMDISTLALLFGLMTIVQVLAMTGGLEKMALYAVKWSKGRPFLLLVILCTMCYWISCFLPNVAAILVIIPVTISIAEMMNLDPRPYCIFVSIASNIGGTSTMVGDPPNLIVAQNIEGMGFVEFIMYVMPGVLFSVPFTIFVMWLLVRKTLTGKREVGMVALELKCRIKDKEMLIKTGIVVLVVLLLMFLTPVHGKDVAIVAILGSVLVLLMTHPTKAHEIVEHIEWDTLFYLGALFVLIEVCVELKLIRLIGEGLRSVIVSAAPESRNLIACTLLLWVSAFVSTVLDNTAFTLTMVKVINIMVQSPGWTVPIRLMAVSLVFGACLGGNATMVGAAANVVGCGLCAQRGYPISMVYFSKFGIPIMLTSVSFCYIYCLFALL